MDTATVTVIAVVLAENLPAALAECAALPGGGGTPGSLQSAVVCLRPRPVAALPGFAANWPGVHLVDGGSDAVRAVLTGAGVPAPLQAGYLAAWQDGDALLVLQGVSAGAQAAFGHALAPHLRTGPLGFGGGGVLTSRPLPPFAAYPAARSAAESLAPAAPSEPPLQPDRPVGPAIENRYVDLRAPARVAPEQLFEITVALTRQAPPAPAAAAALQVRVGAAPPVTVIIYATAFRVIGPARAELPILPDGDSGPLRFHLQALPGVSGDQQISITFLQGMDILGRVVAKVQVGGQATFVSYSGPPPGNASAAGAPPGE